jgi:hypothetical protein
MIGEGKSEESTSSPRRARQFVLAFDFTFGLASCARVQVAISQFWNSMKPLLSLGYKSR